MQEYSFQDDSFQEQVDLNKKVSFENMPNVSQWREQAIFISSTFRDMQAERDILHDRVFPSLRKRLAKYNLNIVPVDLRNGVETTGTESDTGKELQVLDVCLSEIKRCKPFLLVILGERYGWVPDRERMESAVNEKKNDNEYSELTKIDLKDKSVTHLEIEFGALASKDQQKRTHFFFRELRNPDDIPEDLQAVFDDRKSDDEKVQKRHNYLVNLKASIERIPEFSNRRHKYNARFDTSNNTVTDLNEWALKVENLLFEQLVEDCKAFEKEMRLKDPFYDTWQSKERRAMEEFLHTRSERFVGREEEVQNAIDWCLGKGLTQGLLLTGEAGLGKSSLFSRVREGLTDWDEKNKKAGPRRLIDDNNKPLVLFHAAGTTTRAGSPDAILSRWIHELAKELNHSNTAPSEDLKTIEKKRELFEQLLHEASKIFSDGIILLIDSLDSLEKNMSTGNMNWLPDSLPENVRFLATAIPGDESEALLRKSWCTKQEVSLFAEPGRLDSALDFIKSQCEKHHKEHINTEVANALCSVSYKNGPLSCSNPLWLSIALNRIIMLDGGDFEEIGKRAEEKDDLKILNYQLERCEELPSGVEDMYDDLFYWCASRFGVRNGITWIDEMLDYLACSRYGLRESDLEELLVVKGQDREHAKVQEDLRAFSRQFALVRNYLDGHIIQRGELGLWDFVHNQGKKCRLDGHYKDSEAKDKQGENLNNPEYRKLMHRDIAKWLEKQPKEDGLRISEQMWHYYYGDMKEEAGRYYGREESEFQRGELESASKILAELISLGEQKNKLNIMDCSFNGNSTLQWLYTIINGIKHSEVKLFCINIINSNVWLLLQNNTYLITRRCLLEIINEKLEVFYQKCPKDVLLGRTLAVIISTIGDMQIKLGEDVKLALANFSRSSKIFCQLYQENPTDINSARYALNSFDNFRAKVQVHLAFSNPEKMLEECKYYLTIRRKLYAEKPSSKLLAYELSNSIIHMGEQLVSMKKSSEALSYYEEAHEISKKLYNVDPSCNLSKRCMLLSLIKLGYLQAHLGNTDDALVNAQMANKISSRILKDKHNDEQAISDLSTTFNMLGDIQIQRGEVKNAIINTQKALKIREDLFNKAPENIQAARHLSISLEKNGKIQFLSGNTIEALSQYRRSLKIREDLFNNNSKDVLVARDLSNSYQDLGKINVQIGNFDKAYGYYKRMNQICKEIFNNIPEDFQAARNFSASLDNCGRIQVRLGNSKEALRYFSQALQIRETLFNENPDDAITAKDCCDSYLSHYNLAIKTGHKSIASAYAHKFMGLMQRMRNVGISLGKDLEKIEQALLI